MGRGAAARTEIDARRRNHGLPRLGARRPPPEAGRDERAAARDGGDAELRPVQPRPPDLCRVEAVGYRAVVWEEVTRIVGWAKARSAVPTMLRVMVGTLRFAHPTTS